MEKTDNELIAEFMGREISGVIANYGQPVKVMVLPEKPISLRKSGAAIEAKYDTSWDWLMPVVEKIRPLAYKIDIDSTAWRRLSGKSIFSKIEDVYHAVVEFIKWYNSQPPRV